MLCFRVGCSASLAGFPPGLLSLTFCASASLAQCLWINANGLSGKLGQGTNRSCVWDGNGVVCLACSPRALPPRFPLALSQRREFPLPLPEIQLGLLQGMCRSAVIAVSPHVHQVLWSSLGAILPSTCLSD